MKRWLCLSLCLFLLLCGCQSAPETQDTPPSTQQTEQTYPEDATVVGVCFPQSDGIWADRFHFWESALEELGYYGVLQDAQGDVFLQIQQVEDLVDKVDLLVIAPLDSAMLSLSLESAQIPIIAYDSMLTDTDKVCYLVTFDYFQMGQAMGREVYSHLDTAKTMELFMGQAEAEQSLRYYQGLMDILSYSIDDGMLSIPSGHVAFEDTAVAGGEPALAEKTLQRYIELYYTTPTTETAPEVVENPQIIIAGSDQIAQGCLSRLSAPAMVCGLGGTDTEGLSFSISKDYAGLDDACLLAVQALVSGQTPETNLEGGMFNNAINIPTWLGTYNFLYLEEETTA